MVDLGGSLAVASRGLFATGVSTDLNGMYSYQWGVMGYADQGGVVTYLNSGGKIGDLIRAVCAINLLFVALLLTRLNF